MIVFLKIIVFLLSLAIGFYILKKTEPIVRMIGKPEWAERWMPGGTYTMWKFIGIIVIVLGFLFLVGSLDWLVFPGK